MHITRPFAELEKVAANHTKSLEENILLNYEYEDHSADLFTDYFDF